MNREQLIQLRWLLVKRDEERIEKNENGCKDRKTWEKIIVESLDKEIEEMEN